MTKRKNLDLLQYSMRCGVIKKLILEFQETNNDATFRKILKRVDRLLISILLGLRRKDRYLAKMSKQELYQISILALYDCIYSMPADIKPSMIPARIKSYIKAKFVVASRPFKREVTLGLNLTEKVVKDSFTEFALELDSMYDSCSVALKEGTITYEDLELVSERYVEERTFRSLGKDLNISRVGAMKKIKRIVNRIRLNV